jgi:hypothetical protein
MKRDFAALYKGIGAALDEDHRRHSATNAARD